MGEHVLRVQDDSQNIYDIAEQRVSDGSWGVAANDKDTHAKLDLVISSLGNLLTELEQKLEEGQEVALDATTLAALETINVIVSNTVTITGAAGDLEVNDDAAQAAINSAKSGITSAINTAEAARDADATALQARADLLATEATLNAFKVEQKTEADETQVAVSTAGANIVSAIDAAEAARDSDATTLQARADLLATEAKLEQVRSLLNDIYGAVDGLELSVDNIDINTDEVEAKLDILNVSVGTQGESITGVLSAEIASLLERHDNVFSTVNTTTTPLTGNEVFIGGADDLTKVRQINVLLASDVSSATDGIIAEYSTDGVVWYDDIAPHYTYTAAVSPSISVRRFQFGIYAKYFRLKYVNGPDAQGFVDIQTILLPNISLESIHRLGNTENADRSVILTKSGLMAETPRGLFESIRSTPDRSLLITEKGGVISPSGSKYAEGFIDFITHDFGVGSPNEIDKLRDFGTVGAGSGMSQDPIYGGVTFETDSAPGSRAFYASLHNVDYSQNTGHGAMGEQTIVLDPSSDPITGDAYVEWGFISPDGESRFCYGYDVNGFYTRLVSHETLGIHDDKEYQSDWIVDPCDGSQSSQFVRINPDGTRTPEPLSINQGNLFRVEGEFLYFAEQRFSMKAPSGEIITTHVHQYGNDHFRPSIRDANLHLFIDINNGTTGGNIKILSASWHGGVYANKSVSIGRAPSGQLHDVPLGGRDPNNTFIVSLAPSEGVSGVVSDLIGVHDALIFVFSTSELTSANWHWYTDKTTPSTDPYLGTSALDADETGGFFIYSTLISTMIDDYGVLELVNGPDSANDVQAYVWLYPQGYSGSFGSPLEALNAIGFLLQTVTAMQAPDDTNAFLPIGRDGAAGYGSLNVHATNLPLNEDDDAVDVDVQELPEVEDKPLNKFDTGQLAISTASAAQIPTPGAWTPHTLAISNMSGGETGVPVFWGNALVTALTGGYIQAGGTKEFVYNPNDPDSSGPVYVIAGAAGGSANEDILLATSYSATGVTAPENSLVNDAAYAQFDATGEVISTSGYQSSGLTFSEISTVRLGIEAKKEAGTGTEQISYVDSYTATDTGTSVISPTIPADPDYLYIVSVSRRAVDADVTAIVNTLGFSGYTLIGSISDGAESFTDVYRMTGTPTTSGTFTVNFDAVADYVTLVVSRYANVLLSNPIEDIDTFFNASSATASFSMSGTNNGLSVIVIGSEINSHTSTLGYTERENFGSALNNNQLQALITKQLTSTGTEAGASNMSGIGNVTLVGFTLTPRPIPDPELTLSYEISGTPGTTSSPFSISTTSDAEYEVDITGDREWVAADIDNLSLIVTGTDISSIYADVDYIYLSVTSSSGTVRISYEWVGKV